MDNTGDIKKILEYGRWAPSGDNMQTWRFQIIDESHFLIHAHDTRDHCVYDLQGHASQIAVGALLESLIIAASHYQYELTYQIKETDSVDRMMIEVSLIQNKSLESQALFDYLPKRSVQRRALKTIALTTSEKQELQASLGEGYSVQWHEGFGARWRLAKMLFMNGKLRLTLPEAFATHSQVIEWDAQYSKDKIPDQAVGLDPVAVKMMRWALKSWERVKFLNTYFAGTLMPRLQLDLIPALACAGHFIIKSDVIVQSPGQFIEAGRAVQRFWLTATALGLQLQPEMTPLIFSSYHREHLEFTEQKQLMPLTNQIATQFQGLFSDTDPASAVFMGRIGQGEAAKARSLRLSVEELLINENDAF